MKKRLFLLLSILAILASLFSACTPTGAPTDMPMVDTPETEVPTDETTPEPTDDVEPTDPEPTSEFGESPMLADMVAAGELPAVEDRLPEEYQVVDVVDSIGEYGGKWHTVTWWSGAGNIKMVMYDPPIRWKPDYSGYEPGLLVKMPEWSDDGKTITFTFRKGLKWSDGEPFAVNKDLKFWWEELALNEDHKVVSVPWWCRNEDGSQCEMEFVDEVTWVLKFAEPQYIMPYVLAQGTWEWEPLMRPAHYIQQWHPDFTDGATYEELDQMDRWYETPGYPCLMAWCLADYKAGETWSFDRNPYYWKVDPEGNQLPYIDQVEIELVEDGEVRTLQVSQGRYDCTFRGVDSPNEIPFLTEQAEANDYRLVPGWTDGSGSWPGFMVNMDYHENQEYDAAAETDESKEIRALVREQNFRKGLSYALDRERLIDVAWDGLGEAKQFTISPQSPHFYGDEGQAIFNEWASADAQYDPDKAAELWEEIGFIDADGDGWRDLPSGKSFELVVDLNDWGGESITTPSVEVYKQTLEELGVKVLVNNVIGQPEAGTRGDYGVGWVLRTTHASELDLWTYPDWVFPLRGGGEGARAFPMQGQYYQTGGEEGWEPAEGSPAAKLQELYRQGLTEPDFDKRNALVWEAIRVHMEDGPFVIGASGDQPKPVVCKNNFMNVPEFGVLGPWAPGSPGNMHPEQFWMDLD